MRWRLLFLPALLLPELGLDPSRGELAPGWLHPLGTDALGRDGLVRLLHAGSRSLGFASAVALASLALAMLLALGEPRFRDARSVFRAIPPLLLLLPVAAFQGGLGWGGLGAVLAALLALHLEAPLVLKVEPVLLGPAWAMDRVLGLTRVQKVLAWSPWAARQAEPLFPSAWIGALWSETTLRLLGLGPGPQHDSFGLLLNEELPRLSTDPTPLGFAALGTLLLLAATARPRGSHTA